MITNEKTPDIIQWTTWLGLTFSDDDGSYLINEINTKNKKYKIIGRDKKTGKSYKFTPEFVEFCFESDKEIERYMKITEAKLPNGNSLQLIELYFEPEMYNGEFLVSHRKIESLPDVIVEDIQAMEYIYDGTVSLAMVSNSDHNEACN